MRQKWNRVNIVPKWAAYQRCNMESMVLEECDIMILSYRGLTFSNERFPWNPRRFGLLFVIKLCWLRSELSAKNWHVNNQSTKWTPLKFKSNSDGVLLFMCHSTGLSEIHTDGNYSFSVSTRALITLQFQDESVSCCLFLCNTNYEKRRRNKIIRPMRISIKIQAGNVIGRLCLSIRIKKMLFCMC